MSFESRKKFEASIKKDASKKKRWKKIGGWANAILYGLKKAKDWEREFGQKPTQAQIKKWQTWAYGKKLPRTHKQNKFTKGFNDALKSTKVISKVLLPGASKVLSQVPIIGAPAGKVVSKLGSKVKQQGYGASRKKRKPKPKRVCKF